jgi:hypothetical protein
MSNLDNLSELELIELCMKKNVWSSLTRSQRKGYVRRLNNLNNASDGEDKDTSAHVTESVASKELAKVLKPKINFFSGSFFLRTSNLINWFFTFRILLKLSMFQFLDMSIPELWGTITISFIFFFFYRFFYYIIILSLDFLSLY